MRGKVDNRWYAANWNSGRASTRAGVAEAKAATMRDPASWYLMPIERPTPSEINRHQVKLRDKFYNPVHVLNHNGDRQANGSVSIYFDADRCVLERHMWFEIDGRKRKEQGFKDVWFLALREDEIINRVEPAIAKGEIPQIGGYVMAKQKKNEETVVVPKAARKAKAAPKPKAAVVAPEGVAEGLGNPVAAEPKEGTGRYLVFGKYPATAVLRWMSVHGGFTPESALHSITANQGGTPSLTTCKIQLAAGRKRGEPAEMAKEERAALMASRDEFNTATPPAEVVDAVVAEVVAKVKKGKKAAPVAEAPIVPIPKVKPRRSKKAAAEAAVIDPVAEAFAN